MAAAVPAGAELAVAVLRNKNAHWLAPSTSSDSSRYGRSGGGSSGGGGHNNTANTAATLAVEMCDLPQHIAGSSSSFMLLQMCCLALTAQALHRQQHGLSPVPAVGPKPAAAAAGASTEQQQQRQAVPAYHLQLQQALGLPEGLALNAVELELATEDSLSGALTGLYHVRFEDQHNSTRSSSGGSSSSSSTGLQQQQEQEQQPAAAVDAALLAPLLLVLLECCLLQPEHAMMHDCLTTMVQLLDGCEGLDCVPESLARVLPGTVLRLLVPVIRRLDAAPPGAGTAAAAGSGTIAKGAGLVLLALSLCVATPVVRRDAGAWTDDSTVRALMAEFLKQPEQWMALVEAAVKGKETDVAPHVSRVALLLAPATAHACTAGIGVLLSAAAQQRMFSLLISCLKAAEATDACIRIRISADVAMRPLALLVVGDGTSTTTANGKSRLALVAHLLGRAMVSAGKGLQHLASSSGNSSSSSSEFGQQEAEDALITFQRSLKLVASELPLLSPALPGSVLQQLLDEQAALQQQLAALQAQLPELAAAASVGEQLEAFRAALVAQVPVQHCCNNHGCTNRSQDSEQELASGKSCVCSGCMTARYCSRECQVAHYKHWHKAVCKRLRQQRQEQQQQQQK